MKRRYGLVGKPAEHRCYNSKWMTEGLIVSDHDSIYVRESKNWVPNCNDHGKYYPLVELRGIGLVIAKLYLWMIRKIVRKEI